MRNAMARTAGVLVTGMLAARALTAAAQTVQINSITLEGQAYASGAGAGQEQDQQAYTSLDDFPLLRTFHAELAAEGNSAASTDTIDADLTHDAVRGVVTGDVLFEAAATTSSSTSGWIGVGSLSLRLDFTVSGGEAAFSISGPLSAMRTDLEETTGEARAYLSTTGSAPQALFDERIRLTTTTQEQVPLDEQMTLEPGRYVLNLHTSCSANFDVPGGSGDGSGTVDVSFSITPQSNQIFWETAGGEFENDLNWDPQKVPGTGDTAIFDINSQVFVSFGQESSARASIQSGAVTFSGGAYDLIATALGGASRSFVVANDFGQMATLMLSNHALTSVHSAIGRAGGTVGEMTIGAGSTWNNTGRLSVGLDGTGTLNLADGGRLVSAESRVGDQVGSNGTVNVSAPGGAAGNMPAWQANNLAIGLRGTGAVNVTGGEVAAATLVLGGETIDSNGTLIVDAAARDARVTAADVYVGTPGSGELAAINGGRLEVANLTVGASEGATAVARAEGAAKQGNMPATIAVTGAIVVGPESKGEMRAETGGRIQCNSAAVGRNAGGDGFVSIDGGLWVVTDLLTIGEVAEDDASVVVAEGAVVLFAPGEINAREVQVVKGSRIMGNGEIVADAVNNFGGTITTRILLTARKSGEAKQSPVGDVLTIDGDLVVQGGVLELDIGGTAAGQYDQIMVTGDTTIADAIVRLNFVEGYLPATGDATTLVAPGGALSVANVTVEYAGVFNGFMAEVNGDGGGLVFTALNDALPVPAGDLDSSGDANAVDVQLVINQALGLETGFDCDVNVDGDVNAVDIQLVINAALGL